MYSWKTTRIICTVLLLLPLVHLAYLVSRDAMATMDASPAAWDDELHAYARADRLTQLPKDPVVVVGGRRVKLWRDLEDVLSPSPVLMRGLGDAIVEDIHYNYAALIGFYRPHTVILLPGNSELHIRDNKSAEDLYQAIRELVELDASHGHTRHFYIFAPLKTPLYPQDDHIIEETTRLLSAWAQTHEQVVILDANALLSDSKGRPKPAFYRSDGVHLNDNGYLRLSMLLQSQREADTARDEHLAAQP